MEAKINTIIPRERIGVLIGREGEVKSEIEKTFAVSLKIESDSGVVEVAPNEGSSDPLAVLRARDVVTAIARGFSPERAMILEDEDIVFEIIDLREIFGRSESDIARIKGRVIGRDGKIRRLVEEMTEARVSVYGHTIAMIGEYEAVAAAREAMQLLIKGKQHSTVYKLLRKLRAEAKKRKTLQLWQKPPE